MARAAPAAVLGTIAVLVALPGPAPAATRAHRRSVPRGFFGVVFDPDLMRPPMSLTRQAHLIRRAGAQTVGLTFNWVAEQPVAGEPPDFRITDREVAAAARQGLRGYATVVAAPDWGSLHPFVTWSPPLPRPYAAYCAALVRRYGQHGSFWRAHPRLHRRPIRDWQIWNEPTTGIPGASGSLFWQDAAPFQHLYVELLHRAHSAIKAIDPGARVAVGGLIGRSWDTMRGLYHAGARRWFDAVALHPYTASPRDVARIIGLVRHVMNRHGDRRKPIFVSEIGYPVFIPRRPRRARAFLAPKTLEPAQAQWLGQTYGLLLRRRRKLNIGTVLWFAWATSDVFVPADRNGFAYAGLVYRSRGGHIRRKPALFAYYYLAHGLRPRYRR